MYVAQQLRLIGFEAASAVDITSAGEGASAMIQSGVASECESFRSSYVMY